MVLELPNFLPTSWDKKRRIPHQSNKFSRNAAEAVQSLAVQLLAL